MILQGGPPGPPDTSSYYHAAYVWLAVLYGSYIAILWSRTKRVRSRLAAARDRDKQAPRDS